jgi:hypothetical protein
MGVMQLTPIDTLKDYALNEIILAHRSWFNLLTDNTNVLQNHSQPTEGLFG